MYMWHECVILSLNIVKGLGYTASNTLASYFPVLEFNSNLKLKGKV